jgi:hypothetical protein
MDIFDTWLADRRRLRRSRLLRLDHSFVPAA